MTTTTTAPLASAATTVELVTYRVARGDLEVIVTNEDDKWWLRGKVVSHVGDVALYHGSARPGAVAFGKPQDAQAAAVRLLDAYVAYRAAIEAAETQLVAAAADPAATVSATR